MASRPYNPRRRALGASLHGFFAAIPLTCFTGALLADIAYIKSEGAVQWTNFSQWLLAFGEITLGLSVVIGLIDWFANRRSLRGPGSLLHIGGIVLAFVLALFNNMIHARDGWTGVVPTGIWLSGLTVAVLLVTVVLGFWLMGADEREVQP